MKQSSCIPLAFHNFTDYDCHLIPIKLDDLRNGEIKLNDKPNTKEEYISVTYGYVNFNDSYRFFSSSLDSLVKILLDNNHKTPKKMKKESDGVDKNY